MNRATRIIVTTLGIVFGVSGMNHGLFETLQGNTPTGGLFIPAIGESYKFWPHGDEYAFTLIPNFLITGIAAMLTGLAIILWSAGFIHRKHGPTVFILLFIVLFLVGGGVAQVLFFIPLWVVSTRINRPLSWWRKILPARIQKPLGSLWPWSLAAGVLFFLFALEIAAFGFVPGLHDPDIILRVMITSLGIATTAMLVSFLSGFAHDIAMNPEADRK